MQIPISLKLPSQAAEMWLKRKLEVEEMLLPDYDRPLLKITKQKSPLTLVSLYGMGKDIVRGCLP